MTATLDFGGGFAVDMQDPAALYGGKVLAAFQASAYYFVLRGDGAELPLSFRNIGADEWQLRLRGSGFQYIDNEYGVGIDTSAGLVSRIEVLSPADLAGGSQTQSFVLTLGDPASMAATIDALFVQDFSALYAGQALVVHGDERNDRLVGGAEDDQLFGGAGADRLLGGAGEDSLVGDKGKDTLKGGGGADQLAGGGNADTFVFAHLGAKHADTVLDFSHAQDDHLALEASKFAALGASVEADELYLATDISSAGGATAEGQRLLFDTDSGRLFYDADGSLDGAAPRLVATLSGVATLEAGDFIVV